MLEDEKFSNDLKARQTKLTEHELISAYVAISVYKNILSDDEEINWILLARMIIGLPYFDDQDKPDVSLFENIMIQLIHGTIDADGLDYVCRDSWAGGYHNFSINLERLIETIHISKIENKYQLSFSAKGINEIEGVLNVKNFQFLYVINHHKVLLEQYYLIESMKSAAAYHLNVGREKALYELCDFNIFLNEKILPQSNYKLFRPCDDDFISLMKQTPFNDDIYINGWFSRQFLHSPIWKSKIQFFHTFADVLYTIPVPIEIQNNHLTDQYLKNKREERVNAICEKTCKEFILKEFKLEQEDIIILPIEPKIRRINPDELYVNIDNKPINISKLTHDNFSISSEPTKFCYWYVNLNKIEGIDDNLKCNEIIEKIKIFVKEI